MLNRHRELTLPRLTAAPTVTSCAWCLTPQFLWRQAFGVLGLVLRNLRLLLVPLLNILGCATATTCVMYVVAGQAHGEPVLGSWVGARRPFQAFLVPQRVPRGFTPRS